MKREGKISKTRALSECVIPELNDETASEWLEIHPKRKFYAWHNKRSGGWTGWVGYGCIYTITDRSVSESFMHIIWNHKVRVRATVAQEGQMPDGDAYWAKHN